MHVPIHHVHARATSCADSDDVLSCWWRGASGIACANDANVNAKARAISLVMASLHLLTALAWGSSSGLC